METIVVIIIIIIINSEHELMKLSPVFERVASEMKHIYFESTIVKSISLVQYTISALQL